ncbi:MAG: TRAP transporter permease [Peptococcaceae bacterium]
MMNLEKENFTEKTLDYMIAVLAIVLALFHLYTGTFGLRNLYIQRGIHLMLVIFVSILFFIKEADSKKTKWFYAFLLIAAAIPFIHFYSNYEYYSTRLWGIGFTDISMLTGIILVVVIFITCRRAIGWVMPIIGLISILYCFWGKYLPGILKHGGYSAKFVVELSSWSEIGIFSTPLGVAATYLYLFLLFGALIDRMGTGQTIIDLATALAGHQKGGPAKIAVLSSAMMGSISGSPVANVLTTGAFTIPMMKKLGFEKEYAGAVEAVASTGGIILPPVMGVLAFAMIDYAGIPYSKIILSAMIPAILYYLATFFVIHFHSTKLNLRTLKKEELPSAGKVLKEGWLSIVPVFILAVPLMMGYTPLITVSWASLSLIPISFIGNRSRWLTPGVLADCFKKAAQSARIITLPCALAGIIAGTLSVTGVGVRLSSVLLNVSGGSLFVLLLLVALITVIMGCGLPSLLAYIIQLPITIPAVIQMGVAPMGAHLFVVYYSTLAFITPPIGMSLFAASGISGGSLMKTGWNAIKIGAAGFMVPFIFTFCPSILLLDFGPGIAFDIITAVLSTLVLAVAIEGFVFKKVSGWLRVLCFIASILLFCPYRVLSVIGIGILLAGAVLLYVQRNNEKKITDPALYP